MIKELKEELAKVFSEEPDFWYKKGYEAGARAKERELRRENIGVNRYLSSTLTCTPQDLCPRAKHWKSCHDGVVKQFQVFRKAQGKKRSFKTTWPRSQKIEDVISKKKMKVGFCIYCGADSNTIDHLTPKSRGGSDKPSNLAEACYSCNQEKGNMTYDEYKTWLKYHKV